MSTVKCTGYSNVCEESMAPEARDCEHLTEAARGWPPGEHRQTADCRTQHQQQYCPVANRGEGGDVYCKEVEA
jgi:hypothetical protein